MRFVVELNRGLSFICQEMRGMDFQYLVHHLAQEMGSEYILNDVEKQAEAVNTGIHQGGKRGNTGIHHGGKCGSGGWGRLNRR